MSVEIKTCEMVTEWDEVRDEWILCGQVATVAHWDCCGGYYTSYYCADCAFEGGDTDYCEWSNHDLDGNLIAESK